MKKKSRTAATNLSLFLIALPGILYLLINNYAPMLGIFLAFKNYSLMKGPFIRIYSSLLILCIILLFLCINLHIFQLFSRFFLHIYKIRCLVFLEAANAHCQKKDLTFPAVYEKIILKRLIKLYFM